MRVTFKHVLQAIISVRTGKRDKNPLVRKVAEILKIFKGR